MIYRFFENGYVVFCLLFIIFTFVTSRFSVDELWSISVLFDLFFEKSKIHYKF